MKYNCIVHIADIHIRSDDSEKARFAEYQYVFNELINSVKAIATKGNNVLILIAGDIFDTKNKLTGVSVALFKYLMLGLARYATIYFIAGNHDFQQAMPNEPDILEHLMIGANESPAGILSLNGRINYIQRTGYYEVGDNIGIGCVTVRDLYKLGAGTGLNTQAPNFPFALNKERINIALVHATIKGSQFANSFVSPHGISSEWISKAGYSIAMLGDIHKCQLNGYSFTKEVVQFNPSMFNWAYPGSLIQQNFGEDPIDHGFLLWDLQSATISRILIPSPVVRMYATLSEGKWIGKMLNNWYPMDTIKSYLKNRTIHIRVNCNSTMSQKQELQRTMGENVVINNDISLITESKTNILNASSVDNIIKYLSDNVAAFTSEEWKQYLKHPEKFMLPTIQGYETEINKRNNKIKEICAQVSSCSVNMSQPFIIAKIEWDWILCYGRNNYIDFTSLDRKIAVVNAPNDWGKTSLFEIVCLGLFGEAIPSRHDKEHSQSIICNFKPKGESARIAVHFVFGPDNYRIYRSFTKHENSLYQPSVSLEKNGQQLHSGSSAVKKWIHDHIDKIDTFLTSCMLTQKVDNDFFSMKHVDQMQLINRSMGLNYITTITELLHEVKKACKFVKSLLPTNTSPPKEQIDIDSLKEKKAKLQSEYNRINGKINMFSFAGLKHEDDLKKKVDVLSMTTFVENVHKISVDKCRQQCFLLEKEFEGLKNYYDESHKLDEQVLKTSPPRVKHFSSECALWYNRYEEFMKMLKQRFGSVDHFLSLQNHVVAEIDMKEYREAKQYIAEFEASPFKNATDQDLVRHQEQLEDFENARKKLGPKESFVVASRPTIPQEECKQFIEEYKKVNSAQVRDDYNRLYQMVEQKKSVVAEIESIEKARHPFNPSCWACQKQSWHQRLQQLKSILYSLPDDLWSQFEKARIKYEQYKEYERQFPSYQKQLVQWEQYLHYQRQQKILELEQRIEREKQIIANIIKIMNMRKEIKVYKEKIVAWNEQQAKNELISLAHSLKSTYDRWVSEEKDYDIEAARVYEEWLKNRATHNRMQYKAACQQLDEAIKRDDYKYWLFVSSLIPQYEEQKKLKETLSQITQQINEVSFEIGKAEIQNNHIQEQEQRNKEIEVAMQQIDFRYMLALEILQQLGNYKKWLYEQVIKSLLDETNRLLSGNDFTLECKVAMKDGIPCKFNWYISKANRNLVPINKSGGFVQYIVGLALRISLGRFCSTSFRQLFIDEGFVAADKSNLSKMPEFIHSLLSYYRNIILVSHLDIIRDCGDVCINIQRANGISRLVFGDVQQHDGRCLASCKKGGRCKNKAVLNGYCKRHVNHSDK